MTANDTDIDGSEAARLEHRLTKVEQAIVAGQSSMEQGFRGVNDRLDVANGKLGKHETRLNEHDVAHAKADGAREEHARLRIADRSLLAIAAIGAVAAAVERLVS